MSTELSVRENTAKSAMRVFDRRLRVVTGMAAIIEGARSGRLLRRWTGEGNGSMMRWVRRLAAALGMLGLALTTGCPGFFVYPGSINGGGGSTTGNYVYVANASASSVAGFAIGTGTLTALPGSPYALGYSPATMVINPANTILFVGSGNLIYAYAIQSNGSLSLLTSGGTTRWDSPAWRRWTSLRMANTSLSRMGTTPRWMNI